MADNGFVVRDKGVRPSGSGRLAIGVQGNLLSSLWGGMSGNLIARFYPVSKNKDGKWISQQNDKQVLAPLTEATLEMALNWHSPFEQAGAEAKAPMLMAMLQSGAIEPVAEMVSKIVGPNSAIGSLVSKAQASLGEAVGRTGITKLNSIQLFAGMPPVKIQVTALFRAWKDPVREVEDPVNQLMEWALPIELSSDGGMVSRFALFAQGKLDALDVLMPSKAPCCIAMKYKNRVYSPLVIESISHPIASPVDNDGRYVELLVPMTLCSLAAIDRKDWSDSAKM